jgi:hypothetical protein
MNSRSWFASILVACLLQVSGGLTAGAGAATTAPSFLKQGKSAEKNLIEVKHRSRSAPLYLPIAPNYLAYDYPYYYSRGHYPTHIGPGYIYYGYPYFWRGRYLRYGGH